MRVLHVITEQSWRGGENQVMLLTEGLEKLGVHNHILTQPNSGAASRFSYKSEWMPLRMRNDLDIVAAWRLARVCRERQIDIIDAHSARAHAIGMLSRLFYKKPRLIVHRRVESLFRPTLGNRLKYLSGRVDRFVAISSAIGDQLERSGVPRDAIRVVRSAVATPPIANRVESRQRLVESNDIDPGHTLIGTASALTSEKDIPTFLRALARLVAEGLPVSAVIAGDGKDRASLESLARELGIERRARFLGFRDDVPDILAGLDMFVLASRSEGLGTILLDAQHAGATVVGARSGGIPEIIVDGVSGLLFPPGDDAALADALRRLATDSTLRMTLAIQGRQHALKEFSVDRMVTGNYAVYWELLNRTTI